MALAIVAISCDDEDPAPAPISVNFASTEAGISSTNPSAEISVVFSRETEAAGSISLTVDAGSLTYGEDAGFYTDLNGSASLTLEYAAGVESVSFTVLAGSALNISQDETITLTIAEVDESLQIGQNATLTVTFGENFVAQSGTVTLDAGGSEFPKQTYWDISKGLQFNYDKYTWDLGFYSGSENHVVLNNAAHVMARPLDKTDLANVTAEDTVGFASVVSVPNYNPSSGASAWIDDHTGDLSATAFGEIASSKAEAKVFIVKRDGEGRNWKKVKVFATGSGYTIEYADISSSDVNTTEISKNEAYNFTQFDLDNGEVEIAPAKDSWDIMYSTYSVRYPFGGAFIPYAYNDFITINRHSTSAAMVMTEDFAYAALSLSDAEGLEYSTNIDVIGSEWRVTQGGAAILDDRFFVIKDSKGNYYKLQFSNLTNTIGERGYTEVKFEILK